MCVCVCVCVCVFMCSCTCMCVLTLTQRPQKDPPPSCRQSLDENQVHERARTIQQIQAYFPHCLGIRRVWWQCTRLGAPIEQKIVPRTAQHTNSLFYLSWMETNESAKRFGPRVMHRASFGGATLRFSPSHKTQKLTPEPSPWDIEVRRDLRARAPRNTKKTMR